MNSYIKPKQTLALASRRYGDASQINVETRKIPDLKDGEMLVAVRCSGLTTADSMMRKGEPKFARLFLGLRGPRNPYLGTVFSGTIVATKGDTKELMVGQDIFGETGVAFGSNSDYIIIRHDAVVIPKPGDLSFEAAAVFCDGPLTSYNFIDQIASAEPGQRVYINGGAGSLGVAAIQIAKAKSCYVVASGSEPSHAELLKLGADEFWDYKAGAPTDLEAFDIVFDTVGKLSVNEGRSLLKKRGLYMSPVLTLPVLRAMLVGKIMKPKKRVLFAATGLKAKEDLVPMMKKLLDMYQKENLIVPIARTFDLQAASQAHALIDQGKKKKNFVILHKH
ncbi:NAD(P)-dependent alcohol dehydrogenase [Pseudobacteriovorax antillogorgiicola]|uniref:NADPH:quinone reductase n=1 Tax=Pseudobacteriovorax antillogorgiicola TaxID=1513793 RepID=A0A1Y6B946_9BACT|nr:NAD(P)-dependent alcohol dehydrogenase [Pseudobacteriovorax antillogorgiicola]TCS58774.1 NADPH:quinone reductase-like Zn-dependent oxidoreductase [Pseudobacteriovorax antillogorgiicola]SME94896.1 NADPH:quinone reductase [Pseudobacteriovorax antillogorgiicola]